jgi:hypothetical protein
MVEQGMEAMSAPAAAMKPAFEQGTLVAQTLQLAIASWRGALG